MIKTLRFSIIAICFLTVNPSSWGQFAIRGGINVSELDFDNDIFSSDTRTGVQAGVTYTMDLGDRIRLRPGAVLSIKGFESLNQTGDLTYLEVPLSLLFYVIGSKDGIYLEVGPYVGAMLGNDDQFDINYNNIDVGLNIGAGIKLGRIGAGITYGYGFANVIDGEFTMDDIQARNKNIGIFAMVYF
jgi:hypothetical protein